MSIAFGCFSLAPTQAYANVRKKSAIHKKTKHTWLRKVRAMGLKVSRKMPSKKTFSEIKAIKNSKPFRELALMINVSRKDLDGDAFGIDEGGFTEHTEKYVELGKGQDGTSIYLVTEGSWNSSLAYGEKRKPIRFRIPKALGLNAGDIRNMVANTHANFVERKNNGQRLDSLVDGRVSTSRTYLETEMDNEPSPTSSSWTKNREFMGFD